MSMLPTPIPHPLDWFDAPDWTCGALEWVVGVDWPEGDEAAMRVLADEWYAASHQLGPLLDEADRAALAAVAAFGGPDGQVAASILRLWRQLGRGPDAALETVVELFDDLGALVDGTANEIEAVKIEFYIELALLLIELLILIASAAITFGGSLAAAGPAMFATRFAIQQALKKAAEKVLERTVKKGIKDKIKDKIEARVRSKLGRFAVKAGADGLEEGAQELATSFGTQAYQLGEGNRSGYDGKDLALSFGLGTMGGAVGSVASLGNFHASSLLGKFGEHAMRGAGGEILAEVSIGVVTGQGVSWQSLGMAASSSTVGSIVSDAHHLGDLRGLDSTFAGFNGAGTATDLNAPPELPSDSATTVAASTAAGMAAVATDTTSTAGAPTDGTSSGSGPSTATGASTAPTAGPHTSVELNGDSPADVVVHTGTTTAEPMAQSTTPTTAATPGAFTGGPSAGLDSVVTAEPTAGAGSNTAGSGMPPHVPAAGTVAPGPASAPVLVPGQATPAQPLPAGHPIGSVPPVASPPMTARAAPTTTPSVPSPVPPSGAPGAVPQPRPTDPGGAPAPGSDFPAFTAPAANPPPVTALPPPPAPFTPLLEDLESERSWYADEVNLAVRDRMRAVLNRLCDRLSSRCQDGLDALHWQTEDEHRRRADLYQLNPELDIDDTPLIELGQAQDRLRARRAELELYRERVLTPADLDAEAVAELRRIGLGEMSDPLIRRATGGVNDSDSTSRTTGTGHPPAVEQSRRYGKPGGYQPPLALHQQDVELAAEREPDGRPRPFGDLFGSWLRRINDGGPQADPTRSINCVDVVLSVVDTWMHGRPRVAAPRTVDRFTLDENLRPLGGEPGGAQRIEQATGGRFQRLMADHRRSDPADCRLAESRGLQRLEDVLRFNGHGTMAVLIQEYPDGTAHTTTVHNQHGQIVYVDAQRIEEPASLSRPAGAVRRDALLIGARGLPLDLGLPPGHWSDQSDPDTADPEGFPTARSDPGDDPDDMFRGATDDELRELGVGTVTLAELGYASAAEVDPKDLARLQAALPHTALLHPDALNYAQRSITPATKEGGTAVAVETALELHGWRGAPINAVRWGDGTLVGLDAHRQRAAQRTGMDAVPVVVHQPADLIADWPHDPVAQTLTGKNADSLALTADIRRLPDGTLVAGGDEGVIVHHKDALPRTWGEYALFQAAEQRSFLPGQLYGTPLQPMLVPAAPGRRTVQLPTEVVKALHGLVRKARRHADEVQGDLDRVGRMVARQLKIKPPRLVLQGTEHRVKSFDSLVRKFIDESDRFDGDVDEFIRTHANDVLRFSVELPDGAQYTPALNRTLALLQAQGHQLVPGSVKNFWQDGNRYYGVNATLRSPSGQLFEVQFPTAISIRVGRQTHDLYDVVRDLRERPARRVHAFLQMLAVNKQLGIAAAIPPGLAAAYQPKSGNLSKWIKDNSGAWASYQEWLNYHGRDFADVVTELDLTVDDLFGRREPGKEPDGPEVLLLRALQTRRGLAEGGTGGWVDHRGLRRGYPGPEHLSRDALEPPEQDLGLRPSGSEQDQNQRRVPGAVLPGGPSVGRGDDAGVHGRRATAGRGHDPLVLPVAGGSAPVGLNPITWTDVAHLLPVDESGYRIRPEDCERLGITAAAIARWVDRVAPLGMDSPAYEHFVTSMDDAVHADGVAPAQVDARLKGSSANFFSNRHKTLPTGTENPEAAAKLREWFGDSPDTPTRRPFDSMYHLGLEKQPSDYDVQLSSDAMVAQAELIHRLLFPDDDLRSKKYSFVHKPTVEMAFPAVYRWSVVQSHQLGREVAPALFRGEGPLDKDGNPTRLRDTDWRLRNEWHLPEAARELPDDDPMLTPTHTIDTVERIALRESILDSVIGDARPTGTPRLFLLANGHSTDGAAVTAMLAKIEAVPATDLVTIDPEKIQNSIPEYGRIRARGDGRAAAVVRAERDAIMADAQAAAVQQQLDLVCDVGLSDPAKVRRLVEDARVAGYEVRLIGMSRDAETAIRSAAAAAPFDDATEVRQQLRARQDFSRTFEAYVDLVDEAALYDTNGQRPVLLAAKPLTGELTVVRPAQYETFARQADLVPEAVGPRTLHPDETPDQWADRFRARHPVPAPVEPARQPVDPVQIGLAGQALRQQLPDSGRPVLPVITLLLKDHDNHPLNLTAALLQPERRPGAVALITELAAGEALRPYGGELEPFLAARPGAGALFEQVAVNVNVNEDNRSRKQEYVDAVKAADVARQVGAEATPVQKMLVDDYGHTLSERVAPAVRAELAELVSRLQAGLDRGTEITGSARAKNGSGVLNKVQRMAEGSETAPGRPWYRAGDVIDAVGARITVPDMDSLAAALELAKQHFGAGDGGRILEIENMYAAPKSKAPEYRVIPMIVAIEVDGRPYTYELQLTTQRASIAADLEHNTKFKPIVDASPQALTLITSMMKEAAALDQSEAVNEDA